MKALLRTKEIISSKTGRTYVAVVIDSGDETRYNSPLLDMIAFELASVSMPALERLSNNLPFIGELPDEFLLKFVYNEE